MQKVLNRFMLHALKANEKKEIFGLGFEKAVHKQPTKFFKLNYEEPRLNYVEKNFESLTEAFQQGKTAQNLT